MDLLKPFFEEMVKEAVSSHFPAKETKEPEDFLLTVKEAATLLYVTETTIHAWKKNGIIPFHRKGRRVYFKRSELLASLKSVNLNWQN
ncbi:helix-turn-helix domain-containing protein [Rufibacter hautae]|uniref:Helix-turn-helix domain-containing protein n=1 Tax=Rufibacter hautae TaxID=2595005 RepID=A0A5B6TBZ5_9BACT|nr:helix-turn-helix domain-containing protein [Rufibacter hautae]KAA3437140.1 helix-turn-helix domain-containing protein [Rufibacter hautae]